MTAAALSARVAGQRERIVAPARKRTETERIKQGMMQELLTGKTRLAEGE